MNEIHSDALVFFGATGDLAYKKIFPALQAMIKRGHLDIPVIGVARKGWSLDQFRARAKDSVEKHGGLDPAAFAKLSGLLKYVSGDYQYSSAPSSNTSKTPAVQKVHVSLLRNLLATTPNRPASLTRSCSEPSRNQMSSGSTITLAKVRFTTC
jgi:glucose-6-phosphate 1-dehydrogenase